MLQKVVVVVTHLPTVVFGQEATGRIDQYCSKCPTHDGKGSELGLLVHRCPSTWNRDLRYIDYIYAFITIGNLGSIL